MSDTCKIIIKGEYLMSEQNTQTTRPWFFNLRNDGDCAVVRLLHSSTDTIESMETHRVTVDGKTKRIRCLGENCPACANSGESEKRIYVHLWNYDENKEMVWDRTDKILEQFKTLQESWSPLNSAVIKIVRVGNEFPRYNLEIQNPLNFSDVDKSLIDVKLAKFYSMNRNAEDIIKYYETGVFPEKKPYVPKSEYKNMSEEEKNVFKDEPVQVPQQSNIDNNSPIFDPFMDAFITPSRKV